MLFVLHCLLATGIYSISLNEFLGELQQKKWINKQKKIQFVALITWLVAAGNIQDNLLLKMTFFNF